MLSKQYGPNPTVLSIIHNIIRIMYYYVFMYCHTLFRREQPLSHAGAWYPRYLIRQNNAVIPTLEAHAAISKLSDPTSNMLNQGTDSVNVVDCESSRLACVARGSCAQCYE
jgi:hypothetical protein